MKRLIIFAIACLVFITSISGCTGKKSKQPGSDVSANAAGQTAADNSKKESTPNPAPTPVNWKAILYFPDKNAMYVVKEERSINITSEGNSSSKPDIVKQAKLCIEELVKGSQNKELSNSIPKSTKVNSVSLNKGILTVDLSKEFEQDHSGGSTGIIMTMSQLILTLTELQGVEQVAFKIDGKVLNDFKGHIEFNKPFKRSDFEQNMHK